SREGDVDAYSNSATGIVFSIDGLTDRKVARVELGGLEPDTTYYVCVVIDGMPVLPEVKVHTIPSDDSPIRFVTGGDMGVSEDTRILLKNAATHDPMFAVIGGDIAYANGKLESVGKWDAWLNFYTQEMVTTDGFQIPIVLAIGNHEVMGGFNKPKEHAPFFFGFFGQDLEKSYFKRQFGENLALLVLDSGHVTKHEAQVDWIRETLKQAESVNYTSAVYHVPLYPSHRDFMGHFSDQGRQYWAPVFDEFSLTVAFENHDHTFKRSHFIKNGKVAKKGEGTLYLGDGCWGRKTRPVDPDLRWYLDVAGAIQHFWVVDVSTDKMVYRAVDIENKVVDVYPQDESGAKIASKRLNEKLAAINNPVDVAESSSLVTTEATSAD
ncbi:MAG TPA: hypothetical protein DCX06_05925, partial [Opitutae bacterium]|nr:hypothetical protein [Opitutae bacterium]